MSIFQIVTPNTPGAIKLANSTGNSQEEWQLETHKGLVVSTYENNGYSDSDFYAIVWNREQQNYEHIQYATTRFPTYGNYAAADITDPEIIQEIQKHTEKVAAENKARAKNRAKLVPTVGKWVRITKAPTKGKSKCPVNSSGPIMWVGINQFSHTYMNRRYNSYQKDIIKSMGLDDPRDGKLVLVQIEDGRKVFIDAMNTEPVEK